MEKGGKLDKWVLRILGGENNSDGNPRKSDHSSYEELLLQEEAHRQALEQQLIEAKLQREHLAAEAKLQREHLAAEARAEAQHQRELSRIASEAISLDRQREKNLEFIEDFMRENPTVTSMTSNGDSFEVSWDPSLNNTTKKPKKEVECLQCFKKTPAATFCSHCGQQL